MLPWILTGNSRVYGANEHRVRSVAEETVTPIEQRVQSLELACAGMWEILRDKLGVTEDELVAKIQEIDARDGRVDGKMSGAVGAKCNSCGRQLLSRRSDHCNWCGNSLPAAPFRNNVQ